MTDLLLRIGVSNLCVSLALALVAWLVQSTGKRPLVAHLLWLLVLAKLVTPPVMTVPMLEVPWLPTGALEGAADTEGLAEGLGETALAPDGASIDPGARAGTPSLILTSWWTDQKKRGLMLLWLLGSALVLTGSLVRVIRFHRLLNLASRPAPKSLQALAAELAQGLGLPITPAIHTTTAHLSPMVWWIGGKVRIVLPAALPHDLKTGELRWILAHELAHVRRGDHLVRWLEWLACVCFWWNPVAWWARRNLRANEEVCCDALVLSTLNPNPHTYANSLLNTVEFLSHPALRPPAMASEVNSGGFLERRLKMIISERPLRATPRWMHGLVVLFALTLLPLGIAQAQDFDAVGRRLREAVSKGEITVEQASAMMDALRRSSQAQEGERRRFSREEYAKAEAEIKKMVQAGRVSPEDAKRRLGEMRRVMDEQEEGKRTEERRRPSREEYAKAEMEIMKAIQNGRISAEDGMARLEAMRRVIGEQGEEKRATEDQRKKKYLEIEAKIIAAVKAGKLTKEEAGKKLEAVKKELFGKQRKD